MPPLVTDIDLSMDDKFLYVACWGTGDLQQYDVSDPFNPKLTGKVRIGGIVSKATHPGAKNGALSGGPQMVEISRDGRRVYFTNSLYGAIDPQFYPDGIEGWMVKLDAEPEGRHRLRREVLRRSGRRRTARTRCASRAATARRIPTAIPERGPGDWRGCTGLLAMARARRARRISRAQPGMGWLFAVALGLHRQDRRIVWLALAADRPGSCGCRLRPLRSSFCGRAGLSTDGAPRRRRARLDRLGALPLALRPSPPRALRHAGRTCWSLRMVVSDGGCPRRRPDVVAGPDAAVSPKRTAAVPASGALAAGLAGVGVHTLAMLTVTAAIAATVYEWVGVEILRRAWLNIDLIWTLALASAGGLLLLG